MKNISLLFLLIILWINNSYGCICFRPTIKKSIESPQTIIFKGKIIGQRTDSLTQYNDGRYPLIHQIEVLQSWKGLDKNVSILSFYDNQTSCSYKFIKDSTYLIYGYQLENESSLPFYNTDLCTRTNLFSAATADLDSLGVGLAHNKRQSCIQQNSKNKGIDNNPFNSFFICSLIINILLIGFIIIKKRK